MRFQLHTLLITEIERSGQIPFLLSSLRQAGENPEAPYTLNNAVESDHEFSSKSVVLCWQCSVEAANMTHSLGLHRWEEDEQWIQEQASQWHNDAIILVKLEQTPTAELLDVIALIRGVNKEIQVGLGLLITAKKMPTQANTNHQGALLSWALFAQKNALVLYKLELALLDGEMRLVHSKAKTIKGHCSE